MPMETEKIDRTPYPDDGLDRTLVRPLPVEAGEPYASSQHIPPAPAPQRTSRARRTRRDQGRPRHGCLAALLWPVALGIGLLCVARMLPVEMSSALLIPEAVSFVPWLIVPAALIFVLALLWRRGALAICAGIVLAVLAWWHAGYFIPSGSLTPSARAAAAPSAEPNTGDAVMRIMTLNAYNGNASADEVVACVRENNVELLALQEVTWSFLDELAAAGLYDALPYVATSDAGEWDNGGMNCLFSMVPLSDVDSDLLPTDLSALCAGSVEVGGRSLRFVSCHPSSPHLGGEEQWGAGLETIGSLSAYDRSYVIMGDFNATWNHAYFRELLGASFVDAGQHAGEGFHMTWPSRIEYLAGHNLPAALVEHVPALIEIDHIVYSAHAGIVVGDLKTASISGTDHLALIATLEVQSGAVSDA